MPVAPIAAAPRVLITDAAERSMLATSRGLDAGGYEVSAAAFAPLAPGHWSRSCSDRLRVTDPRVDASEFAGDLRRYLERRPCAVVVPGSDFSLLAVSREREQLDGLTHLGLPSQAAVERSFNREILAAAAGAAGLAPAAATRCETVAEAVSAAREFGFPVLLKSISTVQDRGAKVAAGPNTRIVADEPELRSVAASYGKSWLVQQVQSGQMLSVGGVLAEGQLRAIAVSAYRRTWPPPAGNVAFSVTIEPPPGLEESVAALLRHVGWEGIFELELIHSAHGTLTPIDLNPRPYGSMALAVASGANLPRIWCDWVLGRGVEPAAPRPVRTRPGRHYRWEEADLRHLVWQLRRGRYGAAARVLRPRRRVVHPLFRVSDPLPLLTRVVSCVAAKMRARRRTDGLPRRRQLARRTPEKIL
jgi:predicted ATP-grasp superfamily ATP-dependent carboligase